MSQTRERSRRIRSAASTVAPQSRLTVLIGPAAPALAPLRPTRRKIALTAPMAFRPVQIRAGSEIGRIGRFTRAASATTCARRSTWSLRSSLDT